MRNMLAQLLGQRTTEGETRAAKTGSPTQESGGAGKVGVVVSEGFRGGDAEATRIQETGAQQARRSPSPAGVYQGFRDAEESAPVEDVPRRGGHRGEGGTARGLDPEGCGQKGHHASRCTMDGEAVMVAGVEKAEKAAAPPEMALPPGRGRESAGCARAPSMSVVPAQLSPAKGMQEEAEVMMMTEDADNDAPSAPPSLPVPESGKGEVSLSSLPGSEGGAVSGGDSESGSSASLNADGGDSRGSDGVMPDNLGGGQRHRLEWGEQPPPVIGGRRTRRETRAAAAGESQSPLEAECAAESGAEGEPTASPLRVEQLDMTVEEECIRFEGVKPPEHRGSGGAERQRQERTSPSIPSQGRGERVGHHVAP